MSERRAFIGLQRYAAVGLIAFAALQPTYVEASPFINPAPTLEQHTQTLADYLEFVELKKDEVHTFIEKQSIMGDLKNISIERQKQELDMYLPMYLAGQIKYGVPAGLLMIIHGHETTFSSDPKTDNYYFIGGMQRGRQIEDLKGSVEHSPESVDDAGRGWEFLAELPQRQVKGRLNGDGKTVQQTNDWQEIAWAAKHIRERADNPRIVDQQLPLEQRIKIVVHYYYSAEIYGQQRVNRFEAVSRGGFRIETSS